MSESRWARYQRIVRRSVQTDVDDEVAFHFEMRVEQFIAAGMSREEAELAARERFGDVGVVRDTLVSIDAEGRRRLDWRERIDTWWQDIRVALRTLRREPMFAIGVVATLALGIGPSATMFSVIDGLMLRGPSAVADAAALRRLYVGIESPTRGKRTTDVVGYVTYAALRDHAKSFAGVAAYQTGSEILYGDGPNARLIGDGQATWDLFPLLGTYAAVGRFFDSTEDHPPRGQDVVVLGNEFWRSEFGADPKVIGRRIQLGATTYSVVGVAAPGLTGPDHIRVDVWRPVSLTKTRPDWPTTYQAQWLSVVTRLRPGVSASAAADEATSILRASYTGPNVAMRHLEASIHPLWYGPSGQPSMIADVSRWLMAVALIVMLTTCANVANLVVARARRRRREIAVRIALGVTRARLLVHVLGETMLLALFGGAVALVVAAGGARVMRATLLSGVELSESPFDVRLLAFALSIAVLVGLIVGVGPALHASRLSLTTWLKSGERDGGGRRAAARSLLTVTQAAFCVLLLVGASLFVLSLERARSVDLGFQPTLVLRAIPRPAPAIASSPDWKARYAQALDDAVYALRRESWVEHAAITVGSPYGYAFSVTVTTPGRDSLPSVGGDAASISAVSPDYFATLGMRRVAGRLFDASDHAGTARVAIVNETMARTLWPGETALGKCLQIGDRDDRGNLPPCASVVGVVNDVHRTSVREPATMQYYVPLGQEQGIGGSVLVIRPRIPIEDARKALHDALGAMPAFGFTRIETIQEAIDPEIRPWTLGAAMFGVFGLLALVVATVGLYSVIAYVVADRTRELGVRVALGATQGRVLRDVVARGAAMAAAGILVGLLVALGVGRFVQPLLFNQSASDPRVMAGVAALVFVVALVASWRPARRASRVDPVIALRAD